MKKDTRIELVQELEKIEPKTELINQIIAEAKAGEFHDYKNQKYVCGKVAASTLLRQAGLITLAQEIETGVYDETADQEDVNNMRSWCPPELHNILGLEPKQNN